MQALTRAKTDPFNGTRLAMPEQSQDTDPYVFLSYASADRERALPIADRLEAAAVPRRSAEAARVDS